MPTATGSEATFAALSSRQPGRYTTGRNRQINIKATEDAIGRTLPHADDLNLPLGAVLEQALAALEERHRKASGSVKDS